ncbi:MAG: paraquat-inducible protein A [Pseudomonadota bacterium]
MECRPGTGYHRAHAQEHTVLTTHSNSLLACPVCASIQSCPIDHDDCRRECCCCGHVLSIHYAGWFQVCLAFTLTALVMFVIAMAKPFLGIEAIGFAQQTHLLSGVYALYDSGHWPLASLVLLTVFVFPLVEISVLLTVLLSVQFDSRNAFFRPALVILERIRPWNMLEIFLLGVVVTAFKLGDLATLVPGIGMAAFAALVIVLIVVQVRLDHAVLWHWWNPANCFDVEEGQRVVACTTCHALLGHKRWLQDPKCPRCHGHVVFRIPNSVEKSAAFLLAAVVLYIPANILPIMQVTSFGSSSDATILGGVVELFHGGAWFVAGVVFSASVIVPIAKMVVMAYLLWSTQRLPKRSRRWRTAAFKVTEFIGRWSMVDVFVVTLLVAMVQFGLVMNVQVGAALIAFASVVVLTMLAAETFDPRLLWAGHYDYPRA